MSRHPKAGDNKQDWYREEEEVGPETPEAPKPDAGDMATQQKWKNGAQGALTIMLHDGQWSVGVSGLNTAQIRDAACAAIKASYDLQQQAANVRGLNLVKP